MLKEQDTIEQNGSSFRDAISTVDEHGKRVWIYPKKPKGAFFTKRVYVSLVLLTLMFVTPFIKIGAHPLIMLNIFERKFVIFGMLFRTQDFHIFVIGMIALFVFIVIFTIIFGRIWCGWACPQTIFMEILYRQLEYWIEGDSAAQIKLNKGPMNAERIRKKTLKHLAFIALSFVLANMATTYIVGSDTWIDFITQNPNAHFSAFLTVSILTALIYFIFARFREQVCTVVCPYGRLQGVLLDKDSIVVSYDYVRGEERGKVKDRKKAEKSEQSKPFGDCIDCSLCVRVCPTGIDIRNGTQLECVNCTACIDACDEIMDRMSLPKGLIRYASENQIKSNQPFKFSSRIIAYSAVLIVLIGIMGTMFIQRKDVEALVLRGKGQLYQITPSGRIQNYYNLQLINKGSENRTFEMKVRDLNAQIEIIGGGPIQVNGEKDASAVFYLEVDPKDVKELRTPIAIEIYSNSELVDVLKTTFIAPNSR